MSLFEKARKKLHDLLGWGYPVNDYPIGGDAYQRVYACRFCTGRLALDSQGNWFHLDMGW